MMSGDGQWLRTKRYDSGYRILQLGRREHGIGTGFVRDAICIPGSVRELRYPDMDDEEL